MAKITIEKIKQDLETAAYVERLLPPVKPEKYRSWLFEIVYTPQEIAFMERLPIKIKPTNEQIALWERTLDWMEVLEPCERMVVWKRAKRIPWKLICRDHGVTRQRLWIMYNRALVKIQFSIKKCC